MRDKLTAVKQRSLRGVPLFDAFVWGESPHPAAQNLVTKLETLRYHTVKIQSLLSQWGLDWYWDVTPRHSQNHDS